MSTMNDNRVSKTCFCFQIQIKKKTTNHTCNHKHAYSCLPDWHAVTVHLDMLTRMNIHKLLTYHLCLLLSPSFYPSSLVNCPQFFCWKSLCCLSVGYKNVLIYTQSHLSPKTVFKTSSSSCTGLIGNGQKYVQDGLALSSMDIDIGVKLVGKQK